MPKHVDLTKDLRYAEATLNIFCIKLEGSQMSNGTGIHIIKRDGNSEPLDVNKIHKVVEFACEGLTNVSASQVEMSSNIQFYDGMSTKEIQDILIKSANDLITLENPNYQYVAARLLLYGVYKDVYGEFANKSLLFS